MFFEEGWTPIAEITAEVFRRLQVLAAQEHDGKPPRKGIASDLAISVWDICDAATKIGVTGPDGEVIPASKDLVSWANPISLTNEHLNLRIGNVGSTTLDPVPGIDELRARYGSFLHLPVVMPVNNFQSSLTFLEEEIRDQRSKDPEVIAVAKKLLEWVDNGSLLSRDIARSELGGKLTRRKFKLAWALAAQHKPDLNAPRRWEGL